MFLNSVQKAPKEPIPEEQELDFQGLEEEEEEPSEVLDEAGPEAGEPAGQGRAGWEGRGAPGAWLGRQRALTKLDSNCPPTFRRRWLARRAGVVRWEERSRAV